ncbi:hypothetical protein [Burkholderia sp. ABCPW 14]|uniref:hypothetical protein n=1 Tax=Burkholderia sp. ABCPW 14 TaxID=1637860 RepID=UPI0012E3BBB4|nr:hypothetical protein [Burkholderia sp. ABCPW 14]
MIAICLGRFGLIPARKGRPCAPDRLPRRWRLSENIALLRLIDMHFESEMLSHCRSTIADFEYQWNNFGIIANNRRDSQAMPFRKRRRTRVSRCHLTHVSSVHRRGRVIHAHAVRVSGTAGPRRGNREAR